MTYCVPPKKSSCTSNHYPIVTQIHWPVTYIYSKIVQIIQDNNVMSKLMLALVIFLHKAGDPTELTNYRPISLLIVLSKLIEKLINKRTLK